jgi:hypothetical protein
MVIEEVMLQQELLVLKIEHSGLTPDLFLRKKLLEERAVVQ